ncbi:hypothetical protein BKA70DRAFT_1473277 [Coprinopsis sp. MPI-PUGE-AT-0042]|nr:hypothetical protein BKA70DRAFT_1473277 [Coprinopsis sp. MPI-PUGE-AT-0042]
MPQTHFEEGIYAIADARTPNLVLDTKDGKAIVHQFMGTESQQWEITKVLGVAWSIRSISTGRYLGMKPDDKVKNRYELREVEDPFPWHVRSGDPTKSRLFVPYTNHVIDLNQDNGAPEPGTVLYVHENHGASNQQWQLCKGDLHLATSKALRHGAEYRIVNAQSKTAITTNGAKVACYKLDEEKDHQKFVAVVTQNGWAFRNAESQDYLGLPNSVVPFPDGERLSSIKKEFTWVVLPHHEATSKFKIWVPFTSRVLDLQHGSDQDGTPINLYKEHGVDCQWWRFECVNMTVKDGDRRKECLPGAPEPRS